VSFLDATLESALLPTTILLLMLGLASLESSGISSVVSIGFSLALDLLHSFLEDEVP